MAGILGLPVPPARPLPDLFAVASPGRSGTKWYAQLLSTGRSHCFHELTTRLCPYPATIALCDRLRRETADHGHELAGRRILLDGFPGLVARLLEEGERGCLHVGNSDHLATPLLSGLWLAWPRLRFLFSFRDGIGQVDSMARWEAHCEPALRASWQERHGDGSWFELCCHDWAATVAELEGHRDFLRSSGAAVEETRFERVLAEPAELERVLEWVLGEEAAEVPRSAAATVVNARGGVAPSRPPAAIWAEWETWQRAAFTAVCGTTQARLGYALPSAG